MKCLQHQRQTQCAPSEVGGEKHTQEEGDFPSEKAGSKAGLRDSLDCVCLPPLLLTCIRLPGHVTAVALDLEE